MAINWNYDKNTEKATFKPIPVGNYRCRIEEANEKVSQNNNDMIELVLSVSGHKGKLWFYIVFMPEGNDKNGNPLRNITDRNLSAVYECFGITEGDLNCAGWVGKVGGVKVKHEMVDGEPKAKVHYLLNKAQQVALPAWEEGTQTTQVQSTEMPDDIKWD